MESEGFAEGDYYIVCLDVSFSVKGTIVRTDVDSGLLHLFRGLKRERNYEM